MHVRHHHVHAGAHDAQRPAGEHQPLVIQAAHQDRGALALLRQQVFRRNTAVLEQHLARVRTAHAELVELLRCRQSIGAALDYESGEPMAAGIGIRDGVYDHDVCFWRVRDPHLGAVDHEVIAVANRSRAHGHDVRAGTRLAHRQCADLLAAYEPGQVPLLLFGRTPATNLVDAEIGVRAVGKSDGSRSAADFLHRDNVREIAQAGTAELFLDRDAEQPELAEFGPQVGRELIARVNRLRPGRNAVRSKSVHGLSQQVDILAEAEIKIPHSQNCLNDQVRSRQG